MALTHQLTNSVTVDNNLGQVENIVSQETKTGSRVQEISIDLPGGTAATALGIKIDVSVLQSFIMWYSATNTAITDPVIVETNGKGGGATDTFNITRTSPLTWSNGSVITNPFTADVTELYVTPPSTVGEDGTFQMRLIEAIPNIT